MAMAVIFAGIVAVVAAIAIALLPVPVATAFTIALLLLMPSVAAAAFRIVGINAAVEPGASFFSRYRLTPLAVSASTLARAFVAVPAMNALPSPLAIATAAVAIFVIVLRPSSGDTAGFSIVVGLVGIAAVAFIVSLPLPAAITFAAIAATVTALVTIGLLRTRRIHYRAADMGHVIYMDDSTGEQTGLAMRRAGCECGWIGAWRRADLQWADEDAREHVDEVGAEHE